MIDATDRDPKKFRRVREVKAADILLSIALHPNRSTVLLGSSDANVYELDLTSDGTERLKLSGSGHRSYVTGIVAVGSRAISCGYDGQLVWWDLESREALLAIPAHKKWIRRVVAMPNGKYVVSVADDMFCRVWDIESGEMIVELSGHSAMTPHHFPSMLYAVAVSPDGQWIATGDRVGHVAVWDTSTWSKVSTLEAPILYTWDPKARRHSIGGIRSLAFSPDGSVLAVGGTGKINNIDHLDGRPRLELFDWRVGNRIHEYEDDTCKGIIEQIDWIPGTDWLMVTGGDHKGFLTVFDTQTKKALHHEGTNGHIHAMTWDSEAQALFLAAHERTEMWSWS